MSEDEQAPVEEAPLHAPNSEHSTAGGASQGAPRRIWAAAAGRGLAEEGRGHGRREAEGPSKTTATLLLVTVLVIATCGLVYELLASTLASFVLGDAVMQYSTVIGVYLSAMGVGAWLSGYVVDDVAKRFVDIEIAVALVGGASAPILFFAFAHLSWFRVVLYGVVALVGMLVGMEIPLLLRILRARYAFKDLVARVLTVDYLGALVGSLAFPIFFVPVSRPRAYEPGHRRHQRGHRARLHLPPRRRDQRRPSGSVSAPSRSSSRSAWAWWRPIASRCSPRRASSPTRSSTPSRPLTSASSSPAAG